MKSKTKRKRRGGSVDLCKQFQEAYNTLPSVGPSRMGERKRQENEANEYCKTKGGEEKVMVCPKGLTEGCVEMKELLEMSADHDSHRYPIMGGKRRKSRKRTYRRKKIKKSRKSKKSKKSKKSRKSKKHKKSHKRNK